VGQASSPVFFSLLLQQRGPVLDKGTADFFSTGTATRKR
jgi:hypothetical protein